MLVLHKAKCAILKYAKTQKLACLHYLLDKAHLPIKLNTLVRIVNFITYYNITITITIYYVKFSLIILLE